jgi:DNA repair protein RadC
MVHTAIVYLVINSNSTTKGKRMIESRIYEYKTVRTPTSLIREDSIAFTSAGSVYEMAEKLGWDSQLQEHLYSIHFNIKMNVVGYVLMTVGTVDSSQIHAREVFRDAIANNVSKIILCHNHPSGDTTPSSADITITERLVAAGKIIDIPIVDHVIVGQRIGSEVTSGYYSMSEHGQI